MRRQKGQLTVSTGGLARARGRGPSGATHLEGPEDGDDDEQREAVLLLDAVEPLAAEDDAEQEERDGAGHRLAVDPAREPDPPERRAELGGLQLEPARRARRLHDGQARRRARGRPAAPAGARVPARGRPPAALEADHLAPDRVALPHDVLAQVRLELLEREVDVAARREVGVQRDDRLDAALETLLRRALEGERVVDDGRHVVLAQRRVGDLVVPARRGREAESGTRSRRSRGEGGERARTS